MELVVSDRSFPEGPAFAPDGALWWVELEGGRLSTLENGEVRSVDVGGRPNGLAFSEEGWALFCDAGLNEIRALDPLCGAVMTVCSAIGETPLSRPNDLAYDRSGNLVFTCPGDSRRTPEGYIVALSSDGAGRVIARDLYFPNGLCFDPAGRALYVAETYKQRIWRGEWDAETGSWLSPRLFCQLWGPIGPDGMAVDANGVLYVALFDQGVVVEVDPSGTVRDTYEVPGRRPTNVAFDPSGELGLVVTEAAEGQIFSLDRAIPGAAVFRGPVPRIGELHEL